MRSALLLALIVLAGCATPAQRRENDLRAARETCLSMGYQEYSQAHLDCSQNLYLQKQQARSQAAANAMGAGTVLLTTPSPAPAPTSCRWFAGQYVCQ